MFGTVAVKVLAPPHPSGATVRGPDPGAMTPGAICVRRQPGFRTVTAAPPLRRPTTGSPSSSYPTTSTGRSCSAAHHVTHDETPETSSSSSPTTWIYLGIVAFSYVQGREMRPLSGLASQTVIVAEIAFDRSGTAERVPCDRACGDSDVTHDWVRTAEEIAADRHGPDSCRVGGSWGGSGTASQGIRKSHRLTQCPSFGPCRSRRRCAADDRRRCFFLGALDARRRPPLRRTGAVGGWTRMTLSPPLVWCVVIPFRRAMRSRSFRARKASARKRQPSPYEKRGTMRRLNAM